MKHRLKISGVVKIMNEVREALGEELSASEAKGLQQLARNTAIQVEQICSKYGMKPEQLPAPTFRAYQFLKSTGEKLPEIQKTSKTTSRPRQKVTLTRLVSYCNHTNKKLGDLAESSGRKHLNLKHPQAQAISRQVRQMVDELEKLFKRDQASPADLPAPTRRAFQWLKYLANGDHFEAHLQALQFMVEEGKKPALRKAMPAPYRQLPFTIQFYNFPALYRFRIQRGSIYLTANEGFIQAPHPVLKSLLLKVADPQNPEHLQKVRKYADGPNFIRITQALEKTGIMPSEQENDAKLQAIFQRVNRAYFNDSLKTPHLAWNRTVTHRKLGHYQPATDTVILSLTLALPDIPGYVLDYVMYHELLHKKLGMNNVNGRRYAHTREFREEEKKFREYVQAQNYLNQLGEKLL